MSLNFPVIIADESVDFRIIKKLRAQNFTVFSILTEHPGISDSQVIQVALERSGYIITEDKDFGDELVYRKTHAIGGMLLRIGEVPIDARCTLLTETLIHQSEELKNCFAVLTSKKLRIRKYL